MSGFSAKPPRFSAADVRERAQARLSLDLPDHEVHSSSIAPWGDHVLAPHLFTMDTQKARLPAAVLVPIVARDEGATVLLTKRAERLRQHSGQIAFPGGKIDEADGSPVRAALREAEEEIGLAAAHIDPVGYLDAYVTGTGFRIFPVVAIVTPPFDLAINLEEVDDVFEVPVEFLMEPANHLLHARNLGGREAQYYAIPYGDRYLGRDGWHAAQSLREALSRMSASLPSNAAGLRERVFSTTSPCSASSPF